MSFVVRLAQSAEDFKDVEVLIRHYFEWLDVDLTFQAYQAEIENLSLKYALPASAMFLARSDDGKTVGCAGFTALRLPDACEVKRLFVLPEARGRGIAKSLMSAVISQAVDTRYTEMFLHTLPAMSAAIALYEGLGFERIDAYCDNPVSSALFFKKRL